ncbi:MAG TPA: acyl-CoA dehydrogenase family protein [Polyangiaceae bacterium]
MRFAVILSELLSARVRRPVASLEAFLAELRALEGTPFELAIDGGARADRVGYAFVAGIRAAIEALAPDVGRARVPALCATEAHGAHPRGITTSFDETAGTVTGEKRFATLAPLADVLLVLAKAGEREGRNVLRVVLVDPRARGVRIAPMAELSFAPEVPHATVTFDAAPVSGVLEGDGYERTVKPFRTLEDLHVMAALLAHVIVEARARSWPHAVAEDAMAALLSLRGISDLPPLDPAAHIALAGALRGARAVFAAVDRCFAAGPSDEAAQRWARDRPIGDVAERARALRLEAAWRKLTLTGP